MGGLRKLQVYLFAGSKLHVWETDTRQAGGMLMLLAPTPAATKRSLQFIGNCTLWSAFC